MQESQNAKYCVEERILNIAAQFWHTECGLLYFPSLDIS